MKTVLATIGAFSVLVVALWSPPAAAQRYTLEKCLDVALDVSPTVGISRENLRVVRTSVLQSYANFLPNTSASFYAGHSFIGPSQNVFVDAQGRPITPTGFNYESYNFGISGGLTLWDWGANLKLLSQSKNSAEATRHDLEYQKDFIKAAVIREYYDYVRNIKLRAVQEENVNASTRSLEQVEAFYKIGSRTKADFLQARVTLANSQLSLMTAKNAEAIALARLLSRMNMPLNRQIRVDESLEITSSDVDIEREIGFMQEHRSDLQGSRSRVDAARNAVAAAERGRYPSLSGFYNFGWNDREFANDANFFKTDYNWSVGVSMSFDLFDRFQDKSNIMSARAQERIAEYNLQQARLDAVLDVKQIVLNLEQAKERLALSEETVEYAKENLRLAEERYRVGAGTILETIEANASLTEAQASLIEARIDLMVYHADLQRATGRPIRTHG